MKILLTKFKNELVRYLLNQLKQNFHHWIEHKEIYKLNAFKKPSALIVNVTGEKPKPIKHCTCKRIKVYLKILTWIPEFLQLQNHR